jgi:hypothetical protein
MLTQKVFPTFDYFIPFAGLRTVFKNDFSRSGKVFATPKIRGDDA